LISRGGGEFITAKAFFSPLLFEQVGSGEFQAAADRSPGALERLVLAGSVDRPKAFTIVANAPTLIRVSRSYE
jgi:hypothetical protein